LSTREIELRSARGERLAGILHDPEPEGAARAARTALVIISPCFTCTRDIAPVRNLARDLAAAGFRALRFDPFGSGKSEGRFEDATVSKHRDDLVAIARALREPSEPLVLAGHSLGGAVSLLAANELTPSSVITLATNARRDSLKRLLGALFEEAKRAGSVAFDSGDGVIRPLTRAFVEDLEQQDVLAAARALSCPLLVIHGTQDALVPLEAAHELSRGDLAVIEGGGHLLSRREDREAIRTAALAFLGRER
jgi:putative redox protein